MTDWPLEGEEARAVHLVRSILRIGSSHWGRRRWATAAIAAGLAALWVQAAPTGLASSWDEVIERGTCSAAEVLAIHPSDARTVYAGLGSDGVSKTIDGGRVWTLMNDGLSNTWVRGLAVAHADPSILYVATLSSVFKSVDGAESWSEAIRLMAEQPQVVVIDPATSDTAYIGAEDRGVLKTTDGGVTWIGMNNGLAISSVGDLAIAPSDPNTLFAEVSDFDAGSFGAFRTTDGGETWTEVNNGLPTLFVGSFAVHPFDPMTAYLTLGSDGIFKTTTGGSSWTWVSEGLPRSVFRSLAIDPSAPATVYAGGVAGVFKSTNGAASWEQVAGGTDSVNALALFPSSTSHAVVYAGGDEVFRTTSGGARWGKTGSPCG